MPTILKPDEQIHGYTQFNKHPFGLLTVLPNLCKQANSKNIVFDIRKLPPGEYSFPYHYHRAAEEVMYIISGSMKMRSLNGIEVISEGDVVHFETGEKGAHQFFNHTGEHCTYFDIRVCFGIDIVVYPDSGKLMISQFNEVFEQTADTEYFKGELEIDQIWKQLESPAK
jgi:uncharacterized cupin superfamily protein